MNFASRFISMLILLGYSAPATGQADFDSLQQLWLDQQYVDAALELRTYRKHSAQGRNALVDYYLATSYCRIPGQEAKASNYFEWIATQYRIKEDILQTILEEGSKCPTEEPPVEIASLQELKELHGPALDFQGKMLKPIKELKNSYARIPILISRTISQEAYQSRLFQRDDTDAAAILYAILQDSSADLNLQFEVQRTEHFLLVGSKKTTGALDNAGSMLERTLRFFQREFGMAEPKFLITVYLVPNRDLLVEIADRLHGLEVDPETTLGYTSHEDQSTVSYIPSKRALGTLNHELFHLLSRYSYGDIPPWIDEGIAALFEAVWISGERLIGIKNWRGSVLKEDWYQRPSIEELIGISWADLRNGAFDFDSDVAFATARYFFLYLQDEHNKLGDVYQALQQLTPETIQVNIQTDTQRILEEQLGMPIDQIDADFARWVKPVIKLKN